MLSTRRFVTSIWTFSTIGAFIASVAAVLPIQPNSNVNCTFNADLCGWSQAMDDDFDWERVKGPAILETNTGAHSDHHPLGGTEGYYMVTDSKDYNMNQKARLVSPIIYVDDGKKLCFQFFYLMHGAEVGTLSVYLLSSDGVLGSPVWSRFRNQGAMYLQGSVTINETTQIYIEGTGSSGNDGDISLDDVSLVDGPCRSVLAVNNSVNSLTCDFELEDICGYTNAPGNDVNWVRSSRSSDSSFYDHTTRSALGSFMSFSAKSIGKSGSLRSRNFSTPGLFCVTFYYRKRRSNMISLAVTLKDYSENITEQYWADTGTGPRNQWNKVQMTLMRYNLPTLVQLSFDATINGTSGDVSVDDISLVNGTCEPPPSCSFDRHDMCSWRNDVLHDDFDWEVVTPLSDAILNSPFMDANKNILGSYLLLDMARNPSRKEAYLVSELINTRGGQCFSFFYCPMSRGTKSVTTSIWLNIYIALGDEFPGTLYWTYDTLTKYVDTFVPGNLPLFMEQDYRIVIGGYVSLDQSLSLDSFYLSVSNCSYVPAAALPTAHTIPPTAYTTTPVAGITTSTALPSVWDCNFEVDACSWRSDPPNVWNRIQSTNSSCPSYDHSKGPTARGYFLSMNSNTGKFQTGTSLTSNTDYCLSFWLYLYGPTQFDFGVTKVNGEYVLDISNGLGDAWHQVIINLPASPTPFDFYLSYYQQQGLEQNCVAVDDISVQVGKCSMEVGPNCTFDRGLCGWDNSLGSDFNFSLNLHNASIQAVIPSDHTLQTELGAFMAVRLDALSEGDTAHFQSPQLHYNDSVCFRFYYYIPPLWDSDFSVQTLGPQDRHPIPLLDIPFVSFGGWQIQEVTIYDPEDTRVIFTVTVGLNRTEEAIGLDDLTFSEGECPYQGSTDFEKGFDVFHNIFSNNFNWVISSPADGTFPWLPAQDYSENSPKGHFAVASLNYQSEGQKAELWGPLSPPTDFSCTKFSLFIHGKDPGTLNVVIVDYLGSLRTVVWSLTPGREDKDKMLEAQFPHISASKFNVVFNLVLGSDGGWALDSIQTVASPGERCSALPPQAEASTVAPPTTSSPLTTAPFYHQKFAECTFEVNLCSWVIPDYSGISWNRTKGDTGIPFVPTSGRPGGDQYFLTLPTNFESDKEALLQSPSFNEQAPGSNVTRQFDFRFWLNMYGEQVGQFLVELDSSALADIVYFRSKPTNSWERVEFSVSVAGPFSVLFTARRGTLDQDSISIDDIEVSDSGDEDDDTVYSCSFESADQCGFTQDSSDNVNWLWVGGSDGLLMMDHSTFTPKGHAMAVTEGQPGDTARLISTVVEPLSGCLSFWMSMDSDGTALRVYISRGSTQELLLQRQNTQGYVWVKNEAPVSSNVPFIVTLEAEILMPNRASDLLLDDFKISTDTCNSRGACSFEKDTCTWQNSLISGYDFDWIRGNGNTVGVAGPALDTTTRSADGYFMYIDSSGPYHYQDKAWLDSETFPKGTQCLHFFFYMNGPCVGTLQVYTNLMGSEDYILEWSLSGDQGTEWLTAMVTVGTHLVNYNVRFEAFLGYSVTSNIAIDDITFLPDPCEIMPSSASRFGTAYTTPTPTFTNQSRPTALVTCHFDDVNLCGFNNGKADNIWVMSGPDMPTTSTLRPFNGHTSNKTNSFIYPQVGGGLTVNATARIISPTYPAKDGEAKCLEFYYHMNGDQVGQLNVYIAPNGQENNLTKDVLMWSENFDAGPGWKKGRVSIHQPADYHVIFEAVRSQVDYYYGIDDMTIWDFQCGPPKSCDFEDDQCLWSNEGAEADNGFHWQRYRGYERSSLFAPAVDHTSKDATGYYLFVQSSPDNAGKVARIYSQVFAGGNGPYCFHFWYYMFGDSLGQLKVYVRNSISSSNVYSEADLWELDGPADDGWYLAKVNISQVYTSRPFVVILEATVGSTLRGAFGVDDTLFEIADCGTQPDGAVVTADTFMLPDCTFDYGDTCDWVSFGTYTFSVTNSSVNIPLDHTGGTGKFLIADSQFIPQNTSLTLQSTLLPPTIGTSCLTFWYNMMVDSTSDLSVYMVSSGYDLLLWKAFPEKSGVWITAKVNVQNNFDYKLLMTATVGTKDSGTVAIDDITLVHGACSRQARITFEDGMNGFTRTSASNLDWKIMQAGDTYNKIDHSYHSSRGHVLQANFSDSTAAMKLTEVQSPLYPSAGGDCLEFWYAKVGSSSNQLSVRVLESGPGMSTDDSAQVWVSTETTFGIWRRALVDLSYTNPYWIIFQAAANGSQSNGSIVIDDIIFQPNVCPSLVTCDFDVNDCEYQSTAIGPAIFSPVRASTMTLMPADQTLQSNRGLYMEVEFPNTTSSFSADLISPVEQQTTNKCLSFWFYGSKGGTLVVYLATSSNQITTLVQENISVEAISDSRYRSWQHKQVDVASQRPYSVVFEATNQKLQTSFAIDSISLLNGTCDSQGQATTQPGASSALDPKKAMLGCDFENSSFCNFSLAGSFSWKLFSFDSKHSIGTGMDFDHTKLNKYGTHAFMDATGQKFNTTALLISPSFISDKSVCLSFYYAMYGKDVNRLNLYVVEDQTRTLVWTKTGNLGKTWRHRMVAIGRGPLPVQVAFEGVVGRSSQSDIDLDDIWIFDGSCPPPGYCDFEDSVMCRMNQENLDDLDWTVLLAATATSSDPSTDHTYGTSLGHYLYLNMSQSVGANSGKIFTNQFAANTARCLSFWFHITNPSYFTHFLTVSLQDERGIKTDLGVLQGFFKEDWTLAIFPLQPNGAFQVVFTGQSSGSQGCIALDDVQVSPDECESYIDCDFESQDMCGWQQVPEFSTPAWQVILPNHYMTLNFSGESTNVSVVSKLRSLIIPANLQNFCFTFNYMIHGNNVGYLNVSVEVDYPEPQTYVIYSVYRDPGKDSWTNVAGDRPQVDYLGVARFVIAASTVSAINNSEVTFIQISDIQLALQTCSQLAANKGALFSCDDYSKIPIDWKCDFIRDCSSNEDEYDCGACVFDWSSCHWTDVSTGTQQFIAISSIPNKIFTDTHLGNKFITLQRVNGIPGRPADFVLEQELGPSVYSCTLTFSYYMSLDSQSVYGSLYVSMEENNEMTVLWESSQTNNTNWQKASVDIGGIHSRFKIHFFSKYLPFDYAAGIDDVDYQDCSFPLPNTGNCTNQFRCQRTGACLDNSNKLCDFTDQCGDASDESPAICSSYLMDNFEESLGNWFQDLQDDFDWTRHSGSWVSSSSGPRRDHTLGTHFGHYLVFEGGSHIQSGQVARLISPHFLPTFNQDCQIRFYYHMYGSNKGQLTVYIRKSGRMTQLVQFFTQLKDSWLFASSVITSDEPFQVLFEGQVVGQHSTDIGLDDITFTPQCRLVGTSTNTTGMPRVTTSTASRRPTTNTVISSQSSAPFTPSTSSRTRSSTYRTTTTTTRTNTRPSSTRATPSTPLRTQSSTYRTITTQSSVPFTTSTSSRTRRSTYTTTTKTRTNTRQSSARSTSSRTRSSSYKTTTTRAITKGLSVTASPSTSAKAIPTYQATTISQSSGAVKSSVAATTGRSVTSVARTTSAGQLPTQAARESQESSDTWKVPVGVVLGLLAVAAVIFGVFIYLKRTHRLHLVTFPLLMRGNRSNREERNPVFEYDTTGVTPMKLTDNEPSSTSVAETIGEGYEPGDVRTGGGKGISNPIYHEDESIG